MATSHFPQDQHEDLPREPEELRCLRLSGGGAGGDGAAKKKEDEARFPDELWGELMGKGFIAGDERWIVGEDKLGRVTVVRF